MNGIRRDWVDSSRSDLPPCTACRSGRFNQCPAAVLVGVQRDGVFAEIVDLPAVALTRLARDKPADEPRPASGGGLQLVALSLSRVQPGEHVLVFRAGPIGLFAAMLARLAFGRRACRSSNPPFGEFARRWADRV